MNITLYVKMFGESQRMHLENILLSPSRNNFVYCWCRPYYSPCSIVILQFSGNQVMAV